MSVEQAAVALKDANSRDEIFHVLLGAASSKLDAPLVYSVQDQKLCGVYGVSDGMVNKECVKGKEAPCSPLSVAGRVVESGILYLGPIPDTDPSSELVDIEPSAGQAVAVLPVSLGKRVVCLLVGRCREQPNSQLHDALAELTQSASHALGGLILRSKGLALPNDDMGWEATEEKKPPVSKEKTRSQRPRKNKRRRQSELWERMRSQART